jgi:predicted methyltransferase
MLADLGRDYNLSMMAPQRRLLVAVLAAVLAATGLAAQQSRVHPLSGRQYANPMGLSGAPWLDREGRALEEEPERALEIIGIAPGLTVADVGAGSGYFTLMLASRVGPSGRVYANDIQPGMLDLIDRKRRAGNIKNVTLVLGDVDDPRLPKSEIDLALMVDVYHEFSAPQTILRHLREALKPGGRLVLVEYKKEDPTIPINPTHKMSVAEAKLEVEAEGFTLTKVSSELPRQHVLIFSR